MTNPLFAAYFTVKGGFVGIVTLKGGFVQIALLRALVACGGAPI